jgi:hypothetical protein
MLPTHKCRQIPRTIFSYTCDIKDIIRYITRNESVSSGLIDQEVLARNKEMAEQLHATLLDDILHKRP